MEPVKILFLIHDLGQGGAEKVLVNLVNNMNKSQFDITVLSLFGGGVNEELLNNNVKFICSFRKAIPGNSKLIKVIPPKILHNYLVKKKYDIEVSFLQGPVSRIVSGCSHKDTKLINWVHTDFNSKKTALTGYRNLREAQACYSKFVAHAFVSKTVMNSFLQYYPQKKQSILRVVYNTIESDKVRSLACVDVDETISTNCLNLVSVGTLKDVKGFDRLIRVVSRLLNEQYRIHLYLLGDGPLRDYLVDVAEHLGVSDNVSFLGYQSNPYKYVSKCDLYVCSSYREGFSTSVTEALIVGTPVCTVDVSGMQELLGFNNEYGLITENSEDALYNGIRVLLDEPDMLEKYKKKSLLRGLDFTTKSTVESAERFLIDVLRG